MKKQDLIDHLTYNCGLRGDSAIHAVSGVIEAVSGALARGEDVSLRGLGTFSVVQCEARDGIHFRTKEPIVVLAHKAVKFKPCRELKEQLNNVV